MPDSLFRLRKVLLACEIIKLACSLFSRPDSLRPHFSNQVSQLDF